MHRRHRIPDIGKVPCTELGRELTETGSQYRGVLSLELPGHPYFGLVAVGVLDGHTRLAGAA